MILSDRTIREEIAAGGSSSIRSTSAASSRRRSTSTSTAVPRLPQRHHAVHRPEAAAGGPHRDRRGRRGRRVHPPPGRVRARLDARAGRAARRPRGAARGQVSRSAGSGCSSTRTAGFVDAGWDGHLTLELSNVATLPIALYPGMKIGQISFFEMTTRGRAPVRQQGEGLEVPGPARPDAEPLLPQLPTTDE